MYLNIAVEPIKIYVENVEPKHKMYLNITFEKMYYQARCVEPDVSI